MLPKFKRLNLKKDYKWVASGKKTETKYLKLFIKFGENQTPRIGIASSGKSFKNATQRNRARRVASQALEVLYNKLPKSSNILVLPKPSLLEVKSHDVLLDLEEKLSKKEII